MDVDPIELFGRTLDWDSVEVLARTLDWDSVDMLARTPDGDDPVAGLRTTVEVRRQMERLEEVLVRRSRHQGHTWAEIAGALGISKQAVHKKYGGRSLFRAED